jgi:ribosomal protein S18 acetylase RimI-like enzyme
MTVEIRKVGPGDLALFERIAEEVFDHDIVPAVLADYLGNPGHHLWVALCDGQVVGQLSAVVHKHPDTRPTELYVDEVGVSPGYQRRRIASAMIDAAFALGRELGCTEAWLATEPDNEPARALYARRAEPVEDVVMYVFRL